jgi:capsular polysaccharide biosynthesis protein
MPVALAAFCLAGLLALAAGLARGYLRNRFPTATSAARTLNLPLLGVIEDNAAPRSAA